MIKEEYEKFYWEFVNVEVIEVKDFEKDLLFEGCMFIEEMVRCGIDMMRFGLLKFVGIIDLRIGKMLYVVVQFRKDMQDGKLYNMVGFQIRFKWGE